MAALLAADATGPAVAEVAQTRAQAEQGGGRAEANLGGTESATTPGSPEATSRLASADTARRPGVVGALAIGYDRSTPPGLATGWALNQQNADLARRIALRDCDRKIRPECSVVTVFESCAAVSLDRTYRGGVYSSAYGWVSGGDERSVRDAALRECRSAGGEDCRTMDTRSRCNGPNAGFCGLEPDTKTFIVVQRNWRNRPREWNDCRPSITGPEYSGFSGGCTRQAWRRDRFSEGARVAREIFRALDGGAPYCTVTHQHPNVTYTLTVYRTAETLSDGAVLGSEAQGAAADTFGIPFGAAFTR